MSEKGYYVRHVDSGSKVIDAFSELHFDLLILNNNMPDMPGLLVLSKLREDDFTLPPTIMLLASAHAHAVHEIIKAGISAVLVKPISILDLMERVERIFNQEK